MTGPITGATVYDLSASRPGAPVTLDRPTPNAPPPAVGDSVTVNATGAAGHIEATRWLEVLGRHQWQVRLSDGQSLWLYADKFTVGNPHTSAA